MAICVPTKLISFTCSQRCHGALPPTRLIPRVLVEDEERPKIARVDIRNAKRRVYSLRWFTMIVKNGDLTNLFHTFRMYLKLIKKKYRKHLQKRHPYILDWKKMSVLIAMKVLRKDLQDTTLTWYTFISLSPLVQSYYIFFATRTIVRYTDDLYTPFPRSSSGDRTGEGTGAVNCAHSCWGLQQRIAEGWGVSARWCQATGAVVPMGTIQEQLTPSSTHPHSGPCSCKFVESFLRGRNVNKEDTPCIFCS